MYLSCGPSQMNLVQGHITSLLKIIIGFFFTEYNFMLYSVVYIS